jgi:hypothetical protein
MSSKAVEKVQQSVPDLVQTPALQLTAEDVALPRLYIGQFMSKAVQEGNVKMGQIYSALSADDPEPRILWTPGEDGGVLFHVLGLRKGKSIVDGGELMLFDYDDPNAPADAWVTYNYTVALPEVDAEVPHKLLLTRTGRPAALQVNMVLTRGRNKPAFEHAFRLTTAQRQNQKGKFAVAQVRQVEADAAHIDLARSMFEMLSTPALDTSTPGEEPNI